MLYGHQRNTVESQLERERQEKKAEAERLRQERRADRKEAAAAKLQYAKDTDIVELEGETNTGGKFRKRKR